MYSRKSVVVNYRGMIDRMTGYGFVIGMGLTILAYMNVFKMSDWQPGPRRNIGGTTRLNGRVNQHGPSSGPRILCWIPTLPKNYKNKTIAVQETWGPDCDITLFFSSVSDSGIPVIGLGFDETRGNLIKKTMAALRYIFKHYIDKADWFLKADDDTYVIVDNLRHFLKNKNPDAPFYYGSVFKVHNMTYNSGGAGYVMGSGVLRNIVLNSHKSVQCTESGPEDMRVGVCLESLGVIPGHSTDDQGHEIFHWSRAGLFILGVSQHVPEWVKVYQKFWKPHNVVSNASATFHQLGPGEIRSIHFMLNNLTVHGYYKSRYHFKDP